MNSNVKRLETGGIGRRRRLYVPLKEIVVKK